MAQTNFTAASMRRGKKEKSAKESKAPEPETTEPPESPESTGDEVPTGTITEILAWVGDDKERAQEALDVENENAHPRVTLVASLEELLES